MTSDMGELPLGWASCSIEELIGRDGLFVDGDWVESKDQDPNGEVRLIQLADIGDGEFRNKSSRFLTKPTAIQLKCTFLKVGDLLVARMPDPLGRSCIFPLDGAERYVTVVDVCAIRLGCSEIDAKFLMYLVNSPSIRAEINSLQSGSTRKRISRKNLATVKLPLPPLNEQNRIVAKIETIFSELDKGIEALKTAREQLKVYRQAVLKQAFEGKLTARWREENKDNLESTEQLLARIRQERQTRYEKQSQGWETAVSDWEHNGKIGKKPSKPRKPDFTTELLNVSLERPEGWSSLSVGQLNAEIFDGPFGSNLKSGDYVDSGVRVIRLENIGYLSFIGGKHSYITDEKYSSLIRHTVHAGDLIFSSFITEGIRVAILPEDIQRAVNKADCFCIRLDGDTMRNDFLAAFLSCRSAYKQIEADIHGVGRPRINTSQLKGFVVPVCSPDEQDEIMRQIEKKFSVSEHLEVSINEDLDRIETLRQSILEKVFSGQLVAQDPNDESATTLLERIRLEKKARQSPGKSRKVGRRKLINNGKEKRNATLQPG